MSAIFSKVIIPVALFAIAVSGTANAKDKPSKEEARKGSVVVERVDPQPADGSGTVQSTEADEGMTEKKDQKSAKAKKPADSGEATEQEAAKSEKSGKAEKQKTAKKDKKKKSDG